MKKSILVVAIIVAYSQVISQNIFTLSGRVIDMDTKESLPFANIVYQSKSLGTISNLNGEFTISLNNTLETDSVFISFIGYKTFKTVIKECIKKEIFELEPFLNEIDEVVIKAEKIKIKSFMREVISSYNDFRREEPHIAIAHYQEKANLDNKYIMFMESIGYSVFAGIMKDAAPLSNYKFFYENTKSHVIHPSWVKYGWGTNQTAFPAGGSNLNVFRRFEVSGILSEAKFKKYSFKLDSTFFIQNSYVYNVSFKGQRENGTIQIFADTKQIHKIACKTSRYWSTAFHERVKAIVSVQFNYYENVPFISLIKSEYTHAGLTHSNILTILVQKFNDFKLSNEEYWSFGNYDHNPYIVYKPEEWKSLISSNDIDYDKITKDLSTFNLSLENQFVNSSGKWFLKNVIKSENAINKLLELKKNF